MEGPVSVGPFLAGTVLPDNGIYCERRYFSSDLSAANTRMNNEEAVMKFERILNDLKIPLLNATEPGSSGKDSIGEQDTTILNDVEKRIDTLYHGIRELIDNNGSVQQGGGLDKRALFQIFERKGIFTALKQNPDLKPLLINSLSIILKEYPFTRSLEHIHKIQKTPSYQIEIIPNTE